MEETTGSRTRNNRIFGRRTEHFTKRTMGVCFVDVFHDVCFPFVFFRPATSLKLSPSALEWCDLWSCSSPVSSCTLSAGIAQTSMFVCSLFFSWSFSHYQSRQSSYLFGVFPLESLLHSVFNYCHRVRHPSCRHFFHRAEKFRLDIFLIHLVYCFQAPIRASPSIASGGCMSHIFTKQTQNSPSLFFFSSIFIFTFASLSRSRHSPPFKITLSGCFCGNPKPGSSWILPKNCLSSRQLPSNIQEIFSTSVLQWVQSLQLTSSAAFS